MTSIQITFDGLFGRITKDSLGNRNVPNGTKQTLIHSVPCDSPGKRNVSWMNRHQLIWPWVKRGIKVIGQVDLQILTFLAYLLLLFLKIADVWIFCCLSIVSALFSYFLSLLFFYEKASSTEINYIIVRNNICWGTRHLNFMIRSFFTAE